MLAWQGVALAVAMLVIGVPVGVACGLILWHALVIELGLRTAGVEVVGVLIVVPPTILVAVAASLVPSWRLRRQPVGVLLRTE